MEPAQVQVTYMQMFAPPVAPLLRRAEPVQRVQLEIAAYLELYRQIGSPWGWDKRLLQSAAEVNSWLHSGRLRTYVLLDGAAAPMGLCEFDRLNVADVELTNFGLLPAYFGRRLGPWLLAVALQSEWTERPSRIWLHTDTGDHPRAIATYRRAGFAVFDQRWEAVEGL